MKKYLLTQLIVLFAAILSTAGTFAQNITVVPNPTAPDIFAWSGGAVSGYTGTPIILNNSLVLEYNASSTSSLTQIKQQLAVYTGGDSLHLIPNPDAGQGVYFESVQLIFDNKLFFIYLDVSGVQRLASFDGASITLYPNPDAATVGYVGSPRIFNNSLYVAYVNVSNVTQFGRFNGAGITLIPNPDNSSVGFYNNYSVVFDNKICSRYVTAAGPKQLATFDGTKWTLLPNPDNTVRGVFPAFPAEYHNKLYFTYHGNANQYQYLEYNGVDNPTLIANPQNSSVNDGGVTGFPIVYNDTLFFQYDDINDVGRLAKFGGSAISLVPNPDATTNGFYNVPVVYNNNLYIFYVTPDGNHHLTQYQGASNSLKIFPNPDGGLGYWDQPIVYNNELYFQYYNAQSKFQLGHFGGSSIQLITNPPGIYNSDAGNNGYTGHPVIWNNILYMQFASVPYGNAGNLAFYNSGIDTGICPGNNISFKSDVPGATYQWETDRGLGVYRNLTDTAPYRGVTTNTLTLTAPASNMYGYKYRCRVNGNTYSQVFTLKFESDWTGAVSNAWETAGNWSCGAVPDINTDIYISAGKPNFPFTNASHPVRSIHLQNGATLTVGAGHHLLINGR